MISVKEFGVGVEPCIGWWARGDSNARPLPCQGSSINDLQTPPLKTRELHASDLDRKWTAEPLPLPFGPHTDLTRPLRDGPTVASRVIDTASSMLLQHNNIQFPNQEAHRTRGAARVCGWEGVRGRVPASDLELRRRALGLDLDQLAFGALAGLRALALDTAGQFFLTP